MDKGPQCAICFQGEIPLAALHAKGRHVDKKSECGCMFWVCEPCWSEWCGRTNYECLVCHQPLQTQWTRKALGEYRGNVTGYLVAAVFSLFVNTMLGCVVMSLLYLAGYDFPLLAFISVSSGAWFIIELDESKNNTQFLQSRAFLAIQWFILVGWVCAAVYAREFVFVAYGAGFFILVRSFAGFARITFLVFSPWRRGMIPTYAYRMQPKPPAKSTRRNNPRQDPPTESPPRYNLRPRPNRAENAQINNA